ncbi:MAG: DUF2085 domain-containing protein [Thermomicrobiales bacterium]|nr:DUF2085 domain-containing protein [Thermomicrobiales bacterium]
MQATYDETNHKSVGIGWLALPLTIGGLTLLFFAAPWSIEHKAHAALHGLCAQTPSHTFLLGDRRLPFDARMTGIYGGFITTAIYLLATGRHRAAALPSWGVLSLLAMLVGLMAVDGFNSLFLDLGRPHPYQPDNHLRLATGMGAGLSLAIIICYLFAVTLWRLPRASERVARGRDLALLLPLQVPFALLVLSGSAWLWLPIAGILICSAVAVVSSLALVSIVLFRRLDYSFDRLADVHRVATHAVLAGITIMALLSGGRFALERLLGLPPLM